MRQLLEPGRLDLAPVALADSEDERHRIGLEPAGSKEQRVAGRCVEPVRVVDEDEQRRLLGGGREQAERRGADREAVACCRWGERERSAERGGLGLRDRGQHVQDRPRDLEQPGEGELRLRLDPARVQDRHAAARSSA